MVIKMKIRLLMAGVLLALAQHLSAQSFLLPIFGHGAPSGGTCVAATNLGQLYYETTSGPFARYECKKTGWVRTGNAEMPLTVLGVPIPLGYTGQFTLPSSVVASINGAQGAFTFSGVGVDCTTTPGTCVFTGGSGSGTVNAGTQGQPALYGANGTSVTGLTPGIYYCDAFANLNACLTAAATYASTNKATEIYFSDKTYTLSSGPFALQSGMHLHGIHPRLTDPGANPDLTLVANGGTWIDCGGAQCFSAVGTSTVGTNDIDFENIGFENWTTSIATFGSASTLGTSWSRFQEVYGIGSATLNASDEGLVFWNQQHVAIDGLVVGNTNTCLDFEGAGTNLTAGTNSIVTNFYCYTYTKSVANGNSTEPGLLIKSTAPGSLNLLTFIRPQINLAGTGDKTADGIQLNRVSGVTIIGADVEGSTLNAVHLISATANYVDLNFYLGSTFTTNGFNIDANSVSNTILSEEPVTNVLLDPAAVATNSFYGRFAGGFNNAGLGMYNGIVNAIIGTFSDVLSTAKLFTAASNTSVSGNNTFGNYTSGPNGVKIEGPGGSGNWPQLLLCTVSDANCGGFKLDFAGSSLLTTGAAGYGMNYYATPTGRDGHYFRNGAGNVVGAFIETGWTNAVLGAFDTTHDLVVGKGLGFWNGTNKGLFAFPTITAARSWTLPDAGGQVGIIPTASTGHAICETTAHTLGHCSSVVASDGTCTCS